MDISIKSNLCKSIRACGLHKRDTLELVNTIERWVDSSGPEWTVKRLKDYVQWYESVLAGEPAPPAWVAKKAGLPVGVFGKVFRLRNPARALAVLSAHSVFKSREILPSQKEKFLDGLSAKGQSPDASVLAEFPQGNRVRLPKLGITPPPFDAISGFSIPVGPERKVYVDSPVQRILAYCESWQSVPMPTLRYIVREGGEDQIPPGVLENFRIWESVPSWASRPRGYFWKEPLRYLDRAKVAGAIGCIQEPSLKARWIANPNRITQWYLRPLGDHWYSMLRSIPTDCTFDQEKGVRWVQSQLASGVELSGADLTSATDLLDRRMCLALVTKTMLGRPLIERDWSDPVEKSYRSAIEHFMDISSMEWSYPEGGTVKWDQGQPLGTHPSFALLGLTNNLIGRHACFLAGIPQDSFRVIGDDIIMDSRALQYYCRLIEAFGGKINHTKTLTSSCVAEFAGRVILPTRSMNKTVKYKEVSDNSFMEIVSSLGDQAKGLLRPRQRSQYDKFKFVPGYVVDGPYPKNSFGIPLTIRYAWYLMASGLAKERVTPDKEVLDSWQFSTKIYYTLAERGRGKEFFDSVPFRFADDFQSSLASAVVKKGNPLLKNGKTCLEVLEETSSAKRWQSLQGYMAQLKKEEAVKEDRKQSTRHGGPHL
jgi:hypothetical protein